MEKYDGKYDQKREQSSARSQAQPQEREQMIRIDGRGQVIDMLRAADPQYREFLLRLLEKRDPALARALRREI